MTATVGGMTPAGDDRRRYPRVAADILWRAAGLELFHHRRNVANVSLGGMRAYSDSPLKVGQRLECDICPPDQPVIRTWGNVVWVESRQTAAEGGYECGIRFTDLNSDDLQRLSALMVRETPAAEA